MELTVELAPGERFMVPARATRCPACGDVRTTKQEAARARAGAEAQQREQVLERDRWTCRRCGATGVPLEVAHRPGASRARNPGRTRMSSENLEACCVPCHRKEHLG